MSDGVRAGDRPDPMSGRARIRILLLLVLASVGLQLANATLMKLAAATPAPALLVTGSLLAAVFALSLVRFFIWNGIYKRYPISLAYPLSAIFFPAVVAIAWVMGETVGFAQVAGAVLVMAGVIRFVTPQSGRDDDPHFPVTD